MIFVRKNYGINYAIFRLCVLFVKIIVTHMFGKRDKIIIYKSVRIFSINLTDGKYVPNTFMIQNESSQLNNVRTIRSVEPFFFFLRLLRTAPNPILTRLFFVFFFFLRKHRIIPHTSNSCIIIASTLRRTRFPRRAIFRL